MKTPVEAMLIVAWILCAATFLVLLAVAVLAKFADNVAARRCPNCNARRKIEN